MSRSRSENSRRQVRHHERVRIVGPQVLAADLGQVGLVLALVDDVEEVLLQVVHLVLVQVGVELRLHLVEQLAPLGVLHQPQEKLVLRVAHLDLDELADRQVAVLDRAAGLLKQLLGLADEAVAEARLVVDQLVDAGPQARERLLALDRRRAGDDQRRAGLVHEDRVDLVHDAVPVVPLDLVLLARGHAVVAQVVEAEFAGRPVGDVAPVHVAAPVRRHLLLDAADRDAEERVELAHPLGVAAGEVVVDRHELRVPAVQRVEVKGQRGDEGLALAGGHLGDPALVERDAADELDVKMHHVPLQLVLADEGLRPHQPPGGILHRGERLGKDLVQGLAGLDALAKLLRLCPQLVIGKRGVGFIQLVDPHDNRTCLLQELLIVPAGKGFEQKRQH